MLHGLNHFLSMRDQDETYGRSRLKTSAYSRAPAFSSGGSAALPKQDTGLGQTLGLP